MAMAAVIQWLIRCSNMEELRWHLCVAVVCGSSVGCVWGQQDSGSGAAIMVVSDTTVVIQWQQCCDTVTEGCDRVVAVVWQ
jgi:hypothetical protein